MTFATTQAIADYADTATERKPLVLTDFDGVFNAIPGSPKTLTALHENRSDAYKLDKKQTVEVDTYNVTLQWSSELAEDLQAVEKSDIAEFRWLSTWQEDCDVINGVLGTGIRPARFFDKDKHGIYTGKRDYVKETVTLTTRPLVWIDDDDIYTKMPGDRDPRDPATQLSRMVTDNHRVLLVKPDPHTGLTRGQWESVKDFLKYADQYPTLSVLLDDSSTRVLRTA